MAFSTLQMQEEKLMDQLIAEDKTCVGGKIAECREKLQSSLYTALCVSFVLYFCLQLHFVLVVRQHSKNHEVDLLKGQAGLSIMSPRSDAKAFSDEDSNRNNI